MLRLVIARGPGLGRVLDLDAGPVEIGRQQGLGVTIESGEVSRRHARVYADEAGVHVRDLGSSNGTLVNGRKISAPTRLFPGDMIQIGSALIQVEAGTVPTSEMTILGQTSVTVANPELFSEKSGDRLRAVVELTHQLGRVLEVDALLERLTGRLLELFPNADRAVVLLREGDEPRVRHAQVRRGRASRGPEFSRSVLRRVFDDAVAVLAGDLRSDPGLGANATLQAMGVQSLVCVPLQVQGRAVFGALQLDSFGTGRPFSQEDLYLLSSAALVLSALLENTQLQEERLVKERMERDLAVARRIQLGYLPTDPIVLEGRTVDLAAGLQPALEVSGDFYDYFALDDGRMVFAVADVSGKGMPAALFMTQVHALHRNLADGSGSPAAVLDRLNRALARDNPNFLFVTMACGIYEAGSGTVTLAHGGHPPAVLRRRDGRVELVEFRGAPLLGLDESAVRSDECRLKLEDGDAVLLYTDGITESPGRDAPEEMFGSQRLLDVVKSLSPEAPLAAWIETIRAAVAGFSGDGALADDLTLLVLRRG